MNAQMILRDELNYLENLYEHRITDDVLDQLFGTKRIIKVPMFIETLKNYLTKGTVSITRSTQKIFDDLHVVEDGTGEIIAYIYKRPTSTQNSRKSASDVFFDYFDNRG